MSFCYSKNQIIGFPFDLQEAKKLKEGTHITTYLIKNLKFPFNLLPTPLAVYQYRRSST